MDHEDGILLQEWITANPPKDDLIWKEAGKDQWSFVRRELPLLFGQLYNRETCRRPEDCIRVVGTHHSKSVLLPVYSLKVPKIEIRLRNNFYNWVLSVRTGNVLNWFGSLLSPRQRKEQVKLIYAEGFTEDWIFPPFSQREAIASDQPMQFSITLSNNFYHLYTILYLLTEQLGLHADWYEPDESPDE